MEASQQKQKKSRRAKTTSSAPEGEVPDAPRLEDFSQSKTEHTNQKISVKVADTDTVQETIDLPDASGSEQNKENAIDVQEITCNVKPLETISNSEENETQDEVSIDNSVDPCEEALDLPSAPAPIESSSVYNHQNMLHHHQQQHLYPSLGIEDIQENSTSLMNSFGLKVLSEIEDTTLSNRVVPHQAIEREFGPSQIQSLYSNMLLECNEQTVKEFLKSNKTAYDGFELYELLCSYLRACNQLAGCEKSLNDLREKCTEYEKLLWTVSLENLTQHSTCEDGNSVVATHQYHVSKFDKQVYSKLDRTLKETKELIKDSFSLFTYSVQLCKIQVNHFFHKSFKDINLQSFDVQGYYSEYPNSEFQSCANLLRLCISTLFIFIRRPISHTEFLRDCQQWLAHCVGLLLRISTLNDQLFILNHVIRCPAGVIAKKLAFCVQVPKIPVPSSPLDYCNSGFGHLNLDYALTVLSTILNPVCKRDEFLKQIEIGIKTNQSESNHWVVVDSDGEDDPEEIGFFKESDLINLLQQIPFENIFRRVLLVYKVDGEDVYDISISSERSVLRLLAFGTQLVSILGQGFVSYYTDRYRQLIKIIGRLVLHCVQYITDHVECFVKSGSGSEAFPQGSLVRMEYDLFFRNAVGVLFSGKNIGTLQFLAAIPYHLISTEMLWHIYCAMTKWTNYDNFNSLGDISSEFENELVSMNESDAFYLLTALSTMAIAREVTEANFVRVVTLHLFQIGFLSPLTRDCCSKTARDLLGNLTRKYPQLISVLLHTINSKMQILDKFSLYLLKELAFDFWKPTDFDLKLMSHWLVSFSVSSIENQTARFVIQSINWDFDVNDELFLPFDIHHQVAVMIMESNSKWERTQNFLAEGMKQMNAIANRNQDNWAWDMMKRLHLHGFDRNNLLGHVNISGMLQNMPTFETHPELECVRKGVEGKNPLACLLTLYLTPVGHSVPLICSKGFDLIEIMVQSYRLESVINSLFFITPLFVESLDALHSCEKFRNILLTLLAADMTYMRMAKNLISSDFPGDITKLLGEMISAQIDQCSRFGINEKAVIRLWVESLTKLESWNKDINVLYVLDILAKSALTKEDCGAYFKGYFMKLYKEMPLVSQSGIASLFSWSSPTTTLIPNPSFNQTPYFLYFILSIEMELETQSGFWKSLCINLSNPKTSLDTAVKKSSSSTKFATTPNLLTIYRWAQLALDLSNNHELVFLIWQKFFLRYFHRVSDNQTTHYSCVGGRFFEGMINSGFYNKLKKKLNDLLVFCRENLASFERNCSSDNNNAAENPMVLKELLSDKIRLASALVLWIEDSKLQQETLYLPALAPSFIPTLLLSLMEGEEISWHNYVDFDSIKNEERNSARLYMVVTSRSCWFESSKLGRFSEIHISISNCVDDILKRLNSYDPPVEPPPVPVFEDVIPSSSPEMFLDVKSMQNGLQIHFKQLQDFSHTFSMNISQVMALNCAYWESLPDLYKNNQAEMLVNARCGGKSGSRNWESCGGGARVIFKYTEARLNESLGHQIHQNRIEYQSLMNEKGTQPPPTGVCVAAVFIEDFITNLVVYYRRCPGGSNEYLKAIQVGHELFYYATKLINESTDFYPPTRQLFSSLLEVLGREFVSVQPGQCQRLVTTCIQNPKLIGSLAPHLNLATCCPSELVKIYQDVTLIPKKHVDLAFVMLTKFDICLWLKIIKPKLKERSLLISVIWKALTQDGLSPEEEKLMVHDTYRNHLRCMLYYDFPQHYGEILNLILHGMDQNSIAPQIWYDFCNGLSRDAVRFFHGMDTYSRKGEVKRFATEGNILSHQEMIETAHLLTHHFTKERLMHGLYGLYSKYRNYIEPISCFLQMVSFGVVASSLTNSKGTLSKNILEAVWPIIRDMYSPWILPYNQKFIQQNCAQWIQHMNFDSTSVLQPWIGSDSPLAMIIVNDYTDCLMFLVEMLPGNAAIFSYLWNFYVDNFAQNGVKEHVLGVVHNCFVSIPWAMFWPSFSDVEQMCRVVERFLPVCHSFLSVVFAQISWFEWIGNLSPKLIGKGHGMLLSLTIRLANDVVARESPSWIQVMETAETRISWHSISPGTLEPTLNWFVMSIDPRVVLQLDSTHRMDTALLRLLETASGYGKQGEHSTTISLNMTELNNKRYHFVRSYVRLIVSATTKYKNLLETNPKNFEDAIQGLIIDIARTVKRENQSKDVFIHHLREPMNLMSNHSLGTIARNAIIGWCISDNDQPLSVLLAIVHLSYGIKAPAYLTAPLIETAIGRCFQHTEARWSSISEITNVLPDELNNMFDIASRDGHYLLLYSLILKRFQKFVEGGLSTACFFMDLLKNMKPKESNEESLPLVYGIMVKTIVSLNQQDPDPSTNEAVVRNIKKFLLSLAQHLILVGDDKQGWGLLGALGIGKASQLSIRGRLFAKCLGTFLLAQIPTNSPIRINGDVEGHFSQVSSDSGIKPHPEVLSSIEKLEGFKINRQYADLIECIDSAVNFIKEPQNALSICDVFISQLNGYLFSARYLVQES